MLPPRRIAALESVRGMAATVVVLRHGLNALELPIRTQRALVESPLALLLDDQGAVQIFLVLSGYVLAGSLARVKSRVGVAEFYVKRVLRIHPPYVAAVLLAWLASFLYLQREAGEGVSPWLRVYTGVHLDPTQLGRSLLFPGTASLQLPVGWTLRVEMVYSLLLPFLFLIARRAHWSALVALSIGGLFVPEMQLPRYAFDFAIGVAAWCERERLARWLDRTPAPVVAVALAGALALLCSPLWLGWSRPAMGVLVGGFDPGSIALSALGAVALVVLCAHVEWLQRPLGARPLLFLGRISYSLYLVHFTLLLLLAPLVKVPLAWVDAAGLMACVLAASIAASVPLHRCVERPSIALGNRICDALAARSGERPLESSMPGR
jgi:peptidoglycan/LPS O-acetylase OafA/YrhL